MQKGELFQVTIKYGTLMIHHCDVYPKNNQAENQTVFHYKIVSNYIGTVTLTYYVENSYPLCRKKPNE
jgi:hypothetical protein